MSCHNYIIKFLPPRFEIILSICYNLETQVLIQRFYLIPGGEDMVKELLVGKLDEMTPVNKKIGEFFLDHKADIGFLTIDQLSKEIGVSKASLVRFSRLVGFRGFNDFKKAVQKDIKKELSPYEKIEVTQLDQKTKERQMNELRKNELKNINTTLDQVTERELFGCAKMITDANRVFIAGFGLSSYLSHIFRYLIMGVIQKPVFVITGSISEFAPTLKLMEEGDAMVLLTFPEYSKETSYVAECAHETGLPVCLITDSLTCPVGKFASIILLCETGSLLRLNSYTSPMALMHIITNMLSLDKKETAKENVKRVSEIEKRGYQALKT